MKFIYLMLVPLLSLSLSAAITVTETEENDDCTQAQYLMDTTFVDQHVVNVIGAEVLGDDPDYFSFTVKQNGSISITLNNNDGSNHKMEYGPITSTCGVPASPTVLNAKNSVTFAQAVTANTTYYFYTKSNGADGNRDVDYTFTATFTPTALTYTCPNPKQFSSAFTTNDLGSMLIIGNSSLCAGTSFGASDSTCYDPGTTQNNNLTLINVNADTLDPTSTFNSTSAELLLPPGATVLWAGLYWQGEQINGSNAEKEAGRYIKLRHEDDTEYTSLLADEMNWVYRQDGASYHYQGHTEITEFIKAKGNGDIWVADLTTELNSAASGGQYGAWSVAVAYQDINGELRNISIYDGFLGMRLTNEDLDSSCTGDYGLYASRTINLSGFFTPTDGDINSTFFVFAAEGDRPTASETLQLDGNPISDANNPANNPFNSTITRDGNHVTETTTPGIFPSYSVNSLGIDIDTYDVSGLIQNGQKDTNVTLSSTQDYYYPGLFAFSTDLYKPLVCYQESFLVDGLPYDGSVVDLGSVVTMEVNVTNEGEIDALGVSVQNRLQIEFGYRTGSLGIDDIGGTSDFIDQTDEQGDDEADYNSSVKTMTFYLGAGADGSGTGTGGTISQNEVTRFDYNVTLYRGNDQNSTTNVYYVSYTDADSGNVFNGIPMPECTDSASGLNIGPYVAPVEGIDVVDDPATPGVIQTKIVNKPFEIHAVNMISGVETPWTSEFPYPAFMYLADDDCSIPDSVVEPFALAFIQQNDSSARGYQMSDGTSDPVFDKAKRTARVQTSYFDFGPLFNGETNINCTSNSSTIGATGKPHTGVPSCLVSNNPTDHSNYVEAFPDALQCFGPGSPCYASTQITDLTGDLSRFANDYGCLMCITESDAKWTCSTDNFSIRPERFVLDLTTLNPADASTLLKSGQGYEIDVSAFTFGTTTAAVDYNQSDENLTATANTRRPDDTLDPTLAGIAYTNSGDFVNGEATVDPINFSFSDVGKITLDLIDDNWAMVDADDTPLDGYRIKGDVNVTFIPFDFNITAATLTNNNTGGQPFTYFSADMNMSAKIPLTLRAQNLQGAVTQNYADTLYDKPITMSVAVTGVPALTTISAGVVNQDMDFTAGQTVIAATDTTVLSFNFDRDTNNTLNPTLVTGADIDMTATDTDGVTGTEATDAAGSIPFYYGRLHAPRTRIAGNTGNAVLDYEIYCFGTDSAGTDCNATLRDNVSNGLLSEDDVRWYKNVFHTAADGNVTTTTQRNGFLNVNEDAVTNAATTVITYTYNGDKGYPYKTTMQVDNSPWLRWNRFTPDPLLLNEYELEFNRAGNWSGQDSGAANVDSNASSNTNRRLNW